LLAINADMDPIGIDMDVISIDMEWIRIDLYQPVLVNADRCRSTQNQSQ